MKDTIKKVLLKDIIIPAGTVFDEAPIKSIRTGGHFMHTIGLTKDSSGDFIYYIDPEDPALEEYFEDFSETKEVNKEEVEPEPIYLKPWADTPTQRTSIGNGKYVINNLHALANELPIKEMPLEHLNTYNLKIDESNIKQFSIHMRAVMAADLNYPIVLDDEGFVMDGRHRISKALFLGLKTIKFVRFKETPLPDYYEDDEEDDS